MPIDRPTSGPYAVICFEHKQVFLTEDEYSEQLSNSWVTWRCPFCGKEAHWDDDNLEKYLKELETDAPIS